MKVFNQLTAQIHTIRSYDRSIKLFLTIPISLGMYFAVKVLFFNFYILALGFDKGYLGLANGITASASLIFAFPLGVLTDRIGRKRSALAGIILVAVSFLGFLFVRDSSLILLTLFVSGIGETLYMVASTPLLTRLTTTQNRVAVFSLRAALYTFSGVIGSYLGGQLPAWFEALFSIPSGTIGSYRGVLLASFGILLLAIIPIALIPRGQGELSQASRPASHGPKTSLIRQLQIILRKKIIWQLILPNLAIGIGAALMVPYLNLYLVEKFSVTEKSLGLFFSIASLITGVGTLFSPWLARRLGSRIRALVVAQGTSLFFLLLLGFSPWLGMAVIGFWGRNALMNMAQPLFNTFSMEQVAENEQGTLNSLLSLSWQTGWALMPVISGIIQKNFGFTPIFITTSILYGISTVLIWTFFKDSEAPATTPIVATAN